LLGHSHEWLLITMVSRQPNQVAS